jgi:hypothetical protein
MKNGFLDLDGEITGYFNVNSQFSCQSTLRKKDG